MNSSIIPFSRGRWKKTTWLNESTGAHKCKSTIVPSRRAMDLRAPNSVVTIYSAPLTICVGRQYYRLACDWYQTFRLLMINIQTLTIWLHQESVHQIWRQLISTASVITTRHERVASYVRFTSAYSSAMHDRKPSFGNSSRTTAYAMVACSSLPTSNFSLTIRNKLVIRSQRVNSKDSFCVRPNLRLKNLE